MAATKKTKAEKAPGERRRRGVKLRPTELTAQELALASDDERLSALAARVEADGGSVLSRYREPLGGHALMLVALPLDKVAPTPFQRDVSDAHVRKLTRAMDKTKRFLDPIIAIASDEKYYTPNGNHRLTALKELGAKAVIALLVPEPEVAYHILALNIEKAHALRERALEVVRMYRELVKFSKEREGGYELEFEEPALVTLGFAYEKRGRLAGGAYHPALRKVDGFIDEPLAGAVAERERRAALVIELDDAVNEAVAKLKERGLTSPYLKSFVVARVNPLRFIKGDPPSFDELMATMTKRARGMKTDAIKSEDLARSGGAPDEE
ncbi:MAG TPA: ParB/RepB/Spo0J family partition protein [Polyangiaceae bacterium]|nr:ParB/RepB/Spo0J family partition protein [Polyangiaceae bacterium]